jgi:phospholipid/cholesterol/gamma-HCH transport system ATP-binding protein
MSEQDHPILEFQNVTVEYCDHLSLNNVSFRVRRGQTKVIFGAAGSGKTILLKTAMGLIQPSKGSVKLFGRNICGLKETNLFEIRTQIGMLFQESALFDSLTVRDNVAYPLENQKGRVKPSAEEIERRVNEALCFVELQGTQEKFPSELSGGMRRRVGIARANITNPALMLYDSPTAGLDPITANTIMALLVKNRDTREAASLVVSHRLQDGEVLVRYRWDAASNRLASTKDSMETDTEYIVMNDGELVFEGSEPMLLASRDPYVMRFARKSA